MKSRKNKQRSLDKYFCIDEGSGFKDYLAQPPQKNSLYFGKWNFLALISKKVFYFGKWNFLNLRLKMSYICGN